MHRIHVRTGVIEVPSVDTYDERPTHDVFVIPTGPGEEIVEIETFDMGYSFPAAGEARRKPRMRRWRFRAVSVETVDPNLGPTDYDIVVDAEELPQLPSSLVDPHAGT